MTMNNVISKILLYGFIILGALVSLFPFYWLAVMATNSSAAFMRFPPVMVFGGQFMTNMTNLLSSIQFGRAMFNTFVVAVCKTAGGVFFCSLASFYFAKFKFPGRRFLFALCLVTMMIPPQLNLIPQLIIMNKLGWLSTFKALILPGPVSYTHLDVYKRQGQSSHREPPSPYGAHGPACPPHPSRLLCILPQTPL